MIKIGQLEPWTPAAPLWIPGPPRWHALRCAPLREEAAAKHLRDEGIREAFYPVRTRRVTVRGRSLDRRTKFLPGYVFALFPGEPVWHRIIEGDPRRLIRGVLCRTNGEAGILHPSDLRDLRAMADRDEREEQAARERARLKPGDVIRLGILDADAEVVALATYGAQVQLRLFGSDRIVTVRKAQQEGSGT